jgi:uncharacterized protein YuzE
MAYQGRNNNVDKILIRRDIEGDTLNIWFDDPKLERSCEETGDEVVLSKDSQGRVIGFEKLNYRVSQAQRESGKLPIEVRVA